MINRGSWRPVSAPVSLDGARRLHQQEEAQRPEEEVRLGSAEWAGPAWRVRAELDMAAYSFACATGGRVINQTYRLMKGEVDELADSISGDPIRGAGLARRPASPSRLASSSRLRRGATSRHSPVHSALRQDLSGSQALNTLHAPPLSSGLLERDADASERLACPALRVLCVSSRLEFV